MTEIRIHAYRPDHEAEDWRGRYSCSTCGMPRQHRSHEVPEQLAEVAEIAARILGEANDEENEEI